MLRHVLDSAATSVGGGSAPALLLRGEAGIGKTALLDCTAARARAKGFTVLRAVGSEAESELQTRPRGLRDTRSVDHTERFIPSAWRPFAW